VGRAFAKGARAQRLIPRGSRVTVGVSGGAGSAALLYLLRSTRPRRGERADDPAGGPCARQLAAVHVCEEDAWSSVGEAMDAASWAALRSAVARGCGAESESPLLPCPLHVVPLAWALESVPPPLVPAWGEGAGIGVVDEVPSAPPAARARLVALLVAAPDAQAREDMVRHLRRSLLLRASLSLNAPRLALGCTQTRLAARALAEAACGRLPGASADSQWFDARFPCVIVLRPLREVGLSEAAFFCRLTRLPVAADATELSWLGAPGVTLGDSPQARGSLSRAVDGFLAGLTEGGRGHKGPAGAPGSTAGGRPGAASAAAGLLARLAAWPFNDPRSGGGGGAVTPAQGRLYAAEGGGGWTLCATCRAPSDPHDLAGTAWCSLCRVVGIDAGFGALQKSEK